MGFFTGDLTGQTNDSIQKVNAQDAMNPTPEQGYHGSSSGGPGAAPMSGGFDWLSGSGSDPGYLGIGQFQPNAGAFEIGGPGQDWANLYQQASGTPSQYGPPSGHPVGGYAPQGGGMPPRGMPAQYQSPAGGPPGSSPASYPPMPQGGAYGGAPAGGYGGAPNALAGMMGQQPQQRFGAVSNGMFGGAGNQAQGGANPRPPFMSGGVGGGGMQFQGGQGGMAGGAARSGNAYLSAQQQGSNQIADPRHGGPAPLPFGSPNPGAPTNYGGPFDPRGEGMGPNPNNKPPGPSGTDNWQNLLAQGASSVMNRTGPQQQYRNDQNTLIQQLQAQANGQGPSLAQGQLQQATDRNLSQAYAMSQANPQDGGALRNIANQRDSMSQQAAGDSANLRLNEQMQARNQLGQVVAGARGQDMGVQQSQDDMIRFYLGSGMSLAEAQQKAHEDAVNIQAQSYANASAGRSNLLGAVVGAVGTAAAGISDERLKHDIKRYADEVLPGVPLASWRYNSHPEKVYVGVIAQDLEKVAPQYVLHDANGFKLVDYGSFAPHLHPSRQ